MLLEAEGREVKRRERRERREERDGTRDAGMMSTRMVYEDGKDGEQNTHLDMEAEYRER